MNNILNQMLNKYEIKNTDDEINSIKEIVQEIILCGLSRSNFFDKAAFYGGTALRIFYNLDRFSEDLDFSLISPNKDFDITKYFPYIEKEASAYGLNLSITEKKKTSKSNINVAFIKGEIKEFILKFYPNNNFPSDHLLKNLKIKFEVDINPPMGATYEYKYKLLPSPHQVRLYDKESMFASKIHAILYRGWKSRVKGRDLYDYIFYLSNNTKVNLDLIKEKLITSNYISKKDNFNMDTLKKLLNEKFKTINYEEAKEDVITFINDTDSLNIWNKNFFISITDNLKD